MIIGLEDNFYCVHTPIPVEITNAWVAPFTMELRIFEPGSSENLIKSPRLYGNPTDSVFYVDIAPWVRLVMDRLQDVREYTSTIQTQRDDYQKTLTLDFVPGNNVVQTTTKTFVHCALSQGRRETEAPFQAAKLWKCYPVSWIDGSDRLSIVPQTDTPPAYPSDDITYDRSCCEGTYVKWLNEYGFYSYWLFPANSRDEETQGDEIYRIPRNIFDPIKDTNVDTAGFVPRETFTVRDVVNKKFWPILKSLATSPDVYVLKDTWQIGSDVDVNDWDKVIQTDATFERSRFRSSASRVEFEFEKPKVYTQTRL